MSALHARCLATGPCWAPMHREPRPLRCRAVVGIDLGTTNSAVAAIVGGRAQVLPDAEGHTSVPSLIAIDQREMISIGRAAQRAGAGPLDTFYSFKRLMGHKLDHIMDDAMRMLYTVVEGERGEAMVYSSGVDELVSPEDLSAWLLRHLAGVAEASLGEAVTGAVVTVPAHFNFLQRSATVRAAEAAGLAPVQLLQEPVAAALAYGINGGTDGDVVLVFDLGGGTYDISILQAFEGILEVLGTGGDSRLGGDDIDARLADWLAAQCGEGGCSREWALQAAEQAKVQLSWAAAAEIALPGGRGNATLTEAQFEALTADLFERMADQLASLGSKLFVEWAEEPASAVPGSGSTSSDGSKGGSHDASSSQPGTSASAPPPSGGAAAAERWAPPPRRVTRVALVGQSTRLPAVQRFVRRVTGVDPEMGVDPADAVALGAAIQAGLLVGEVGKVEIMDGSYARDLHNRVSGMSAWQP